MGEVAITAAVSIVLTAIGVGIPFLKAWNRQTAEQAKTNTELVNIQKQMNGPLSDTLADHRKRLSDVREEMVNLTRAVDRLPCDVEKTEREHIKEDVEHVKNRISRLEPPTP